MSFVLGALTLAACETAPKIDYVILSGNVSNTEAENVMVATNSQRFSLELKDGTFSDTIKLDYPQYMRMMVGREYTNIFLEPGKNVEMTVDMTNMDSTISYAGAGGESNNYLAKKLLASQNDMGFMDLFGKEADEFIQVISDMKASRLATLTDANVSNMTFINLEKQSIESQYLAAKINYESYYQYVTKNEDFKVEANFLDDVHAANKDDEAAYKSGSSYTNLVMNYFTVTLMQDNAEDAFTKIGQLKSEFIKEAIAKQITNRLTPGDENLEAKYAGVKSVSKDSATLANIEVRTEKLRKLMAGNPSPTFDYENYNGGNTTLADLKGKYVYVDVWATWCGPCKREIPFLKELEREYHGQPIEFVSISVDRKPDYDKWREMVADKELKGVQLFADKDWKSDFVQGYDIQGIPRFILIDPDGNIVNPNEMRPSSPKIRDYFNGLLGNPSS